MLHRRFKPCLPAMAFEKNSQFYVICIYVCLFVLDARLTAVLIHCSHIILTICYTCRCLLMRYFPIRKLDYMGDCTETMYDNFTFDFEIYAGSNVCGILESCSLNVDIVSVLHTKRYDTYDCCLLHNNNCGEMKQQYYISVISKLWNSLVSYH